MDLNSLAPIRKLDIGILRKTLNSDNISTDESQIKNKNDELLPKIFRLLASLEDDTQKMLLDSWAKMEIPLTEKTVANLLQYLETNPNINNNEKMAIIKAFAFLEINGLPYSEKLINALRSVFNNNGNLSPLLEEFLAIFGIHVWNDLESGKISVEAGPRMAAVNQFIINVKGKGGHGSMPYQGVDPIMAGAAVVMNLQTIVSREFDPMEPAVLSVDIFNSGSKANVLPENSYLEGTTRCFSREINQNFEEIIGRVAQKTAASYRAEAKLEYNKMTLPLINDQEISAIAHKAAAKFSGQGSIVKLDKTTGGEDFSFFAAEVPAAFAFVGSKNKAKGADAPHHHPEFNIDEDALKTVSGLYAQFALDFLNKGEVE
jgi:hypothetical protein